MAFLVYLQIELHLPEGSDLKGKRKEVQSVKAQLMSRHGATVSETDHHDLWQRATLACAVVGRDASGASERADSVERLVRERYPDGCVVERVLRSGDELLDG